MYLRPLIPAFLTVFTVYSLGIFFAGETGVLAMDEMMYYRGELRENLSSLEKRHSDLAETMENLRSREDVVRLRARSLEYYGKNEKVVRISGWKNNRYQPYSPGRIIRFERHYTSSKASYRAAAAVGGLGLYILLLLGARRNHRQSARSQRASL